MCNRTLIAANAYVDSSDPNAVGWTYRLSFDDGHEERGPLGGNTIVLVRSNLEALVVAHEQGLYGGGDESNRTLEPLESLT